MKWLDFLERRVPFLTIPQFPLFLATANGVCYFLTQAQPEFVSKLTLSPTAIRAGEWWRVLSFLFVPPLIHPILLIFWLFLLYQFAQSLENAWGEFRFFFFYLFGAVVTAAASVLILNGPIGNAYLNTTLFLAFATLFPDYELLLFFFLPIRIKYLAYLTWLMTITAFLLGSMTDRVAISASLANYFLFFGSSLWRVVVLRWGIYKNRRRLKR